jgi:deazaflavin-dependent oxidoreductase (nitroreductase family)
MINLLIKIFMGLNRLVIRASRGTLGTLLLGQTVLLLHSTGRRSGRERITPISYFATDGCYFLVGSNWGRQHNAAWYYNLLAHPCTLIEVKGRTIPVEAFLAEGDEYDRLWEIAVKRYRGYRRYKEKASRHIPIVILKPVE